MWSCTYTWYVVGSYSFSIRFNGLEQHVKTHVCELYMQYISPYEDLVPMHLRTFGFHTYLYVLMVCDSHTFKVVLFFAYLTDFNVFGRVLTVFRRAMAWAHLL